MLRFYQEVEQVANIGRKKIIEYHLGRRVRHILTKGGGQGTCLLRVSVPSHPIDFIFYCASLLNFETKELEIIIPITMFYYNIVSYTIIKHCNWYYTSHCLCPKLSSGVRTIYPMP